MCWDVLVRCAAVEREEEGRQVGRRREVFAGVGKRMKREREKREVERALGIVSMTYVALTLSAKRL